MKYYEIDFLEAGEKGNGDAIALRYLTDENEEFIHVVDGGYKDDGQKLIDHIKSYYTSEHIDNVVLTHPDGDHAAGLETILESSSIGNLWMNRPWLYVDELLPHFTYPYTRDGLIGHLKRSFPHTATLEEIAVRRGININEGLQGKSIGVFTVLAPSKSRYLDTIVNSVKTSDAKETQDESKSFNFIGKATALFKQVLWGQENLKGGTEGTAHENEASIVQFAEMCDHKILLTGDAGVEALEEAYNYCIAIGVSLPGIDKFQVPHHGSRRNLSSDVLDKWLGSKLSSELATGKYSAIVSANSNNDTHPKKAVIRALVHRGASVVSTKGTLCASKNSPDREGWSSATPFKYPSETES